MMFRTQACSCSQEHYWCSPLDNIFLVLSVDWRVTSSSDKQGPLKEVQQYSFMHLFHILN